MRMGVAILKFDTYGADIKEWIKPLSSVEDTQDSTIENREYITRIGRRDHYNSKGKRLYSLRAILRQDRANYYKGLGDLEDSAVGAFDSIEKRELFNTIKIKPKGLTFKELEGIVINGNPLLKIEISHNKLEITKLQ